MYSSPTLALKYLSYFFHAYNGKGHGVHSPFVFDFISKVLNDNTVYTCYGTLESARNNLLKDRRVIPVQDYGAGSSVIRTRDRKVSAIAASSLKPKKFSTLLHRMVRYYHPSSILELGTSLGITTSYMAKGNPDAKLLTLEGSDAIAGIAAHLFREQGISNVSLLRGEFSATLPRALSELGSVDFAFIDGNHRYEPTMQYFEQIRSHCHTKSVLIFDDIHWSREMEKAWDDIRQHDSVTLSIDLFFIGIVFFDNAFLVKQHFPIRF